MSARKHVAGLSLLFTQLLLNSRNNFAGRQAEGLSKSQYRAERRTFLGPFQSGNVTSLGPGIQGERFLRQAVPKPKLP